MEVVLTSSKWWHFLTFLAIKQRDHDKGILYAWSFSQDKASSFFHREFSTFIKRKQNVTSKFKGLKMSTTKVLV